MKKNDLWIILTLVVGFLGFMIGYSVPPFVEVGFHTAPGAPGAGSAEQDLMKQYEQLYNSDE